MLTGAEIVRKYEKADDKGRVEIICKNYPNFKGIVESCTDGLVYQIYTEHEYLRSRSKGDLGVRVQTSNINDITQSTATSRTMIREAIVANDFSGGELEGIERAGEYERISGILHIMRIDYDLFNSQITQLRDEENELFMGYLLREKDFCLIADEQNILYNSAVQKIRRIKYMIRESILEYKEFEHCIIMRKRVM